MRAWRNSRMPCRTSILNADTKGEVSMATDAGQTAEHTTIPKPRRRCLRFAGDTSTPASSPAGLTIVPRFP